MTTKTVLSKLRGTTQALYIFTSNNNARFEFIFTNMSMDHGRRFTLIFDVYRLYQQTFLYRELKLRTSILQSKQLKILQQEQVYSTIQGIWNLSSDQGNLGTFVLTNIRLVWYADINEAFNISLPYMQIRSVGNSMISTIETFPNFVPIGSRQRIQIRSSIGSKHSGHSRRICSRISNRSSRSFARSLQRNDIPIRYLQHNANIRCVLRTETGFLCQHIASTRLLLK